MKESKRLYLFYQCSGNSHSCVQIKSSDNCDGVSAKLMFLSSYDYTFNPLIFIISLQGSHFGSRESTPISHFHTKTVKA